MFWFSYIYSKSVKSTCLSRWSRASQSPNKVEKQPKSTPDMYTPPRPLYRRGADIYIPTGHSLLLSGLYSVEFCEDSDQSQTTSINAFYVNCIISSSEKNHYGEIRCKVTKNN